MATDETTLRKYVTGLMNFGVIALSIVLIIWISLDTFESQNILQDYRYMHFQFWVCLFFVCDFFVGLYFANDRLTFFRRHIIFLLLSIPYINIISWLNIELSHDAAYFVRFIPLARGALAMSIVLGYLSSNPVSSLFLSYLSIIVMVTYFCSLIFYQRECGLNPEVHTYWTALWWSAMNMTTVGCNISPVTPSGKIIAVILPMCGMIIFPLFTVYLTDYVTRMVKKGREKE
ncbi:MAG: potassium channel family protein [Muribaculaceae bacterium]